MYQLLIPALAFIAVVGIGGAVVVARASRQRLLHARIHGGSYAALEADMPGASGQRLMTILEQVGRTMSTERPPSGLREKLMHAGYHGASSTTIYVGLQLFLLIAGLAIAAPLFLALELPLLLRGALAFLVVALMALLPNFVLSVQKHQRRTEVQRHLPDAIDLLEICVSAGMGLDMAWSAVADEMRGVSSVIADEMSLVNLEVNLGSPRADALRNMARRTGVDDISSLVAALVQSERFGTSVSQALRTYAEAMRTERSQRAEEAAEKLMVKLLFPMLIFIFPVLFIVILGPAVIKIMAIFAN